MPVIAPVPFPWRRPVRVEAPVPPFATVKSFVRLRVSIHAVVEVNRVEVAFENALSPVHVLLFARSVVDATVMFAEPSNDIPLIVRAVSNTVAFPAVKLAPVPVMFVPTSVKGVPSHEEPEMVRAVVDAPPFMEKSPDVIVDEALERKPFVNVARPVCVSVPVCVVLPETVSEPSVASCEKRFVDDAVVENRFVVVPDVRERVQRVESPFTLSAPKFAVLAFDVVEVAVLKYPVPLAVMLVVDAPPNIVKSPLVIVEEALERKPLVNVPRPERNDAPETEIAVVLAYGNVFAIEVEVAVK